jgi:hypothetical protein
MTFYHVLHRAMVSYVEASFALLVESGVRSPICFSTYLWLLHSTANIHSIQIEYIQSELRIYIYCMCIVEAKSSSLTKQDSETFLYIPCSI